MNSSACQSLRSFYSSRTSHSIARTLTTISPLRALETHTTSESDLPPPIPPKHRVKDTNYILTKKGKIPIEKGPVIGSRRRRLAIASSPNIPFSLLPYQCFQEARKIIGADRLNKIEKIEQERRRIAEVTAADASTMGGEAIKKGRLKKLEDHLEKLKVLADVNDPLVKKRFEDDGGDMSKPIYRHLAKQKWLEMKRKIMVQRLNQMNVVPDIVPFLEPQADVTIHFGRHHIQPGAIVPSNISTIPPKLHIQVFERGSKKISIAIVDPDIPDVDKDGFDFRCHFLAANIPIDPTTGKFNLADLDAETQVILPWLPPHAQKGTLWHRLAIFILQQDPTKQPIDVSAAREREVRMGFNTRSWISRSKTSILTATLFRNEWDEQTSDVMKRFGLEGADVEWKRKRSEKLPYKKKDGERYR